MTWFTLGTRGSPLALAQSHMTAAALAAAHGRSAEEIAFSIVKTTGDLVQDRPLAEIGGKALWTKELDAALMNGRIRIAVHSLKDVETQLPEGVVIGAVLPRADAHDRMLGAASLLDLPPGARLGTSSPRRAAQARAMRPDLRILPFRGNVDTRIRKLAEGEAEATLLAAAGLDRLGRPEVGTAQPFDHFLPAPSQAAVGITARADDPEMLALLSAIDHAPTHAAIRAERFLLAALNATCHTCVAAHAVWQEGCLSMEAEILAEDGSERVRDRIRFAEADTRDAVIDLAARLLDRASPALRTAFGAA